MVKNEIKNKFMHKFSEKERAKIRLDDIDFP